MLYSIATHKQQTSSTIFTSCWSLIQFCSGNVWNVALANYVRLYLTCLWRKVGI